MTLVVTTIAIICGALSALLASGEVAIRLLGFAQFPLYQHDSIAGYRMKPEQRGRFRRRNKWRYDNQGMRRGGAVPSLRGSTILLGDSIVDGGTGLDQVETIAARLEHLSNSVVYPIAAPGWSLGNELAALEHLSDWHSAARLVLVLNLEDFDYVASPSSEYGFPTRYRWLLLPWLIRRYYFLRRPVPGESTAGEFPANPALRAQNLAHLARVAQQFAGPIIILRYPRQDDAAAYDPYFDQLALTAGHPLLNLANAPGWNADCYRDIIHPNACGTAIIAAFLHQELAQK